MARHEFRSSLADGAKTPAKIRARIDRLTPEQVRSEIKCLEADNARMQAILSHRVEAESVQTLADREMRAKDSAEALMRQLLRK